MEGVLRKSYSTEIALSRNEVATITADLTKAYVPSAYGALSLQSDPAGADIYLDNEYKGISPLTLQGVAIGSHSILTKKDGYSEYSGDVHIVSDQASGLSVTLTGIVTAAPTSVLTQPPVPVPTKSPLSPWTAVCGLTLAGLGYAVRRNGQYDRDQILIFSPVPLPWAAHSGRLEMNIL